MTVSQNGWTNLKMPDLQITFIISSFSIRSALMRQSTFRSSNLNKIHPSCSRSGVVQRTITVSHSKSSSQMRISWTPKFQSLSSQTTQMRSIAVQRTVNTSKLHASTQQHTRSISTSSPKQSWTPFTTSQRYCLRSCSCLHDNRTSRLWMSTQNQIRHSLIHLKTCSIRTLPSWQTLPRVRYSTRNLIRYKSCLWPSPNSGLALLDVFKIIKQVLSDYQEPQILFK